MSRRSARVDECGRAYKGSQLQVQIYVNRRAEELSRQTLKVLPAAPVGARLRWVSPLEIGNCIEKEKQDKAFLDALGFGHVYGKLREFWPRFGPVWDALAIAEGAGDPADRGVVLVEAKSHPGEIYGNGCGASATPRKKIKAALDRTKGWLGGPEDANWTGPLYQSANRLAHLYFFRKVVHVPAWLVNICFLNDPHGPTTREGWEQALPQLRAELGLAGVTVPFTADVFLDAGERGEVIGGTGAK